MKIKKLILLVFALSLIVSTFGLPNAVRTQEAQAAAPNYSFRMFGYLPGSGFPLSYIQIPYHPDFNYFPLGITIEAWVRRDDASRSESIVCNGWVQSYCLSFAGGKVRFQTNGGASFVDSNSSVPAGVWTHIAVTYNNSEQKIYINGMLDKVQVYPGTVGQAGGTPLGIGADLVNSFTHNYFAGRIDEVRIWDRPYSSYYIANRMFTSFTDYDSSLLGYWKLDGNALNSNTAEHHGSVQGGAWDPDGAVPHDLRIPQVQAAPLLDGICDMTNEYANAVPVAVSWNAPTTTAYLMHTGSSLWACFYPLTQATHAGPNWTALYLDRDWSRDALAQPADLTFEIYNTDATAVREGNGVGDYVPSSTADNQWGGKFRACCGLTPQNTAEFRIDLSLIGPPGSTFGLKLAQNWVNFTGDNRDWPALSVWNSPSTWAAATLGGQGQPFAFGGKVQYQPRNPSSPQSGVGGVRVNLLAGMPNSPWVVADTTLTSSDGSYSLQATHDYTQHRIELDAIGLPRGFVPYQAYRGNLLSTDPRLIDFGTNSQGSYPNNNFYLQDSIPPAANKGIGPYFLIVAPQAVISGGALTKFADYKRRLGFDVEVYSVEDAHANFPGTQLNDRIRNLEIARRNTYGSRFRYLMLVGPDSVIPHARMAAGVDSSPLLISDPETQCRGFLGGWITDWYYADLTSNWDGNNNGCLGDGMFGDPSKSQQNGYQPDSGVLWQADIAVGRLPLSAVEEIRAALDNSMAFEQQTPASRQQALLAASMFVMRGRCWAPSDDPNGQYYQGEVTINGVKHVCDNLNNSGYDSSYYAEQIRVQALAPAGFSQPQVYYENMPQSVGGSPFTSPQVVTETLVVNALNNNDYGLVYLAGHGNAGGAYKTYWAGDANNDGVVTNPTQPSGNPPKGIWEMAGGNLFTNDGLGKISTPQGDGAIWIVSSCTTGDFRTDGNFGANLLRTNAGAAWVGGAGTVPVGTMDRLSLQVTRSLVSGDQRLGDALWDNLGILMQQINANPAKPGWWVFDVTLFGDPTLSYWGSPAADAVMAPWPMLRQSSMGNASSPLTGPSFPTPLWTYSAQPRVLDTLQPSPVVRPDNNVVFANAGSLDILNNGQLKQSLPLNAPAFGTPALTSEGVIYVVDRNGRLYAFEKHPLGTFYALRWSLDLVGGPLTSPVVGPDGMIAIAVQDVTGNNSEIVLVRPGGTIYRRSNNLFVSFSTPLAIPGRPVGALTVTPDRLIYFATSAGEVWRLDLYCPSQAAGLCAKSSNDGGAPYTTALLYANNSLYAGAADGLVVRKEPVSLQDTGFLSLGSPVSLGPIAGPGGQVLVGAQNNFLYSLNIGLTGASWTAAVTNLRGLPAYSAEALWVTSGDYLQRRDPYTGEVKSVGYLGASPNGGSIAIGYGRQVFVQTGAGRVMAFTEGWAQPPINLYAMPKKLVNADQNVILTMQLNWDLPPAGQPGAGNSLMLQRSQDDSAWEDLAVLPPATAVFTDSSMLPGKMYSYRIQALGGAAGADSDFTSLIGSLRSLPLMPASPTLTAVTAAGADRLKVDWSLPSGSEITGLRLERSATAAGPYAPVASPAPGAASQIDSELAANATYYYRLIAINASGESLPSNFLSGTTRQVSLAAPQAVTATRLANGNIQVSWSGGPPGATAVIEGQEQGVRGFEQLGTAGASGPFTFTPAQVIAMSFRVKFVQGSQESPYGYSVLALQVMWEGSTMFLPMVRK